MSGFDRFWDAYPLHVAEAQAREEWKRIPGADLHAAEIILAVEKYKASGRWDDPQFIPYPANFLKGRRWKDEIGPRRKSRKNETDFQRRLREINEDHRAGLLN